MDDSIIVEMEVSGTLMPVVVEFRRFKNRVDIDEIMDTDGEDLDLSDVEREHLQRIILRRSEGLCKAG